MVSATTSGNQKITNRENQIFPLHFLRRENFVNIIRTYVLLHVIRRNSVFALSTHLIFNENIVTAKNSNQIYPSTFSSVLLSQRKILHLVFSFQSNKTSRVCLSLTSFIPACIPPLLLQ